MIGLFISVNLRSKLLGIIELFVCFFSAFGEVVMRSSGERSCGGRHW